MGREAVVLVDRPGVYKATFSLDEPLHEGAALVLALELNVVGRRVEEEAFVAIREVCL